MKQKILKILGILFLALVSLTALFLSVRNISRPEPQNVGTRTTLDITSALFDPSATSTPTADKIPIYDTDGQLNVSTTPSGSNDATSKTYVDTAVSSSTNIVYAVVSDTLQTSSDALTGEASSSYLIRRSFSNRIDGTFRIKFDLRSANGTANACARIYKNGSAFGTERCQTSSTYTTYSEDLSFNLGDNIELYQKSNGSFNADVINFRIYFTPTVTTTYQRQTLP